MSLQWNSILLLLLLLFLGSNAQAIDSVSADWTITSNDQSSQKRLLTTSISSSTQSGLCGFIAATNIANASGYSAWQCSSTGVVATQPCNGSTPVWTGIKSCSTAGDVTGLSFPHSYITGRQCAWYCSTMLMMLAVGTLPESIIGFSAVTYVDISYTNLAGMSSHHWPEWDEERYIVMW